MSESSRAREKAASHMTALIRKVQTQPVEFTPGIVEHRKMLAILSDFEKDIKWETVEVCKEVATAVIKYELGDKCRVQDALTELLEE